MMFRMAAKSVTKFLAPLATAFVLSASLATTSQADLIQFRPDGSTTTYATSGLGFGPGSAVAQAANPLVLNSTFQFTYQTHLTSLVGVSNVTGLNQTFQVTEVGTLTERVTGISTVNGVTTATFALVPGATNRISIYENNAVVYNDAAGTGFTAGTEIARLNPTGFPASQFSTDGTTARFNQSGLGGNNSGTGLGQTGSGSTSLNNSVASTNASYFITQPLVSSIFNANINSIFDAVPPALLFTNPITSVSFAPVIGAVNAQAGSGPDIEFQVSGFTQSFSSVPEPASIAMTTLGLVGVAAGSYRARRRALARA